VQIGSIKKGINPPSIRSLLFSSPHTWLAAKTGIITGIISLAVSTSLIAFLSIYLPLGSIRVQDN